MTLVVTPQFFCCESVRLRRIDRRVFQSILTGLSIFRKKNRRMLSVIDKILLHFGLLLSVAVIGVFLKFLEMLQQ